MDEIVIITFDSESDHYHDEEFESTVTVAVVSDDEEKEGQSFVGPSLLLREGWSHAFPYGPQFPRLDRDRPMTCRSDLVAWFRYLRFANAYCRCPLCAFINVI